MIFGYLGLAITFLRFETLMGGSAPTTSMFFRTSYTDEQIVNAILTGGALQEKAIGWLYPQLWPMVKKYVTDNRGSAEDARDIFQDGLTVLYEKVKSGDYRGDSKISSFVYSVCRHLWLNKLRKAGRHLDYEKEAKATSEVEFDPDKWQAQRENETLAQELLSQLGETCQQLLKWSIFENLKMEVIRERLNYKSEQIARNKKYKCLEQLKKLVDSDPHWKQLSNELR